MADPLPHNALSLRDWVEPFALLPEVLSSADWQQVGACRGLHLGTAGEKTAWLVRSEEVCELPIELPESEIYMGFVAMLVLTGEISLAGKVFAERTLIGLDLQQVFEGSLTPAFSAYAGAEVLYVYPGAADQADRDEPLQLSLANYLGPLKIAKCLAKRRGGRGHIDWLEDPPRAYGCGISLCRVPSSARLRMHQHGHGGEVNFVFGESGQAADQAERVISAGELFAVGPFTEHKLEVRSQVIWATAAFGKTTYPH